MVEAAIVSYGVDVLEGFEEVAGEHHWSDGLLYLAVSDHVGFAGREGEHLVLGHAAVPVLDVNTVFDAFKQVVEGCLAVLDEGVGHADDRREAVVDGAGVAGGSFTGLGSSLSGVQSPDQDAVADERGQGSRGAFIVVFVAAAHAGLAGAVGEVEMGSAELAAQIHQLF